MADAVPRRRSSTAAVCFITLVLVSCGSSHAVPRPAIFIFGDSLVECGNNNFIATLSRANYYPNGIDFGGPTGRFTNGRTIVDIVGQNLGLPSFTPPYMDPATVGPVVLTGVNYASGAGGILNKTGKLFGDRINMDAQIDNFANTRQYIIGTVGDNYSQLLLRSAVFSITVGSNDFINNYLTPVVSVAEQQLISPQMFVSVLIAKLRLQLTRLYNFGARKLVVTNVGPIGCIPSQRDLNPSAGEDCVSFPNELAQKYNLVLRGLVDDLNDELRDATFLYADVYSIVVDIIENYRSYGFENANSPCCRLLGRFGGLVPCGPSSKLCNDRSKFVFWDPYHPSEAANIIIARRLLDGSKEDIYPINVRKLATSG